MLCALRLQQNGTTRRHLLQFHQVHLRLQTHPEAAVVRNIEVSPEAAVVQEGLCGASDDGHLAPNLDTGHSQLVNEIWQLKSKINTHT